MLKWCFETVLEKLDDIETTELLLDYILHTLEKIGVSRFLYIFIPQDACFHKNVIEINHRGFSGEFLVFPQQISEMAQTDAGAKYLKLKAASSVKAFNERDKLAEALFETMIPSDPHSAELWLKRDALMLPVHSAYAKMGIFCVPLEPERQCTKYDRKLQLLCQAFHQRYCELWELPDERKIILTEREQDILLWSTLGKSNTVIADILGLSKHTVDGYIRQIFLKLNVNDRVTAGIKALEMGLFQDDIVKTSKAYI